MKVFQTKVQASPLSSIEFMNKQELSMDSPLLMEKFGPYSTVDHVHSSFGEFHEFREIGLRVGLGFACY